MGYKLKTVLVDANTATILRLERETLIRAEKQNDELVEQLIIAKAETDIIYKTRIKEVPKYITKIQKVDGDCNISNGAKRLLNATVNPLSTATTGVAGTDGKPSDIREADLINYTLRLLRKYHNGKDKHNLLVQWHRDNQQKFEE
jgi:hypothetical protein